MHVLCLQVGLNVVQETPTPLDMPPATKYPLHQPPLALMDKVREAVAEAEPPRYEDQLKVRKGRKSLEDDMLRAEGAQLEVVEPTEAASASKAKAKPKTKARAKAKGKAANSGASNPEHTDEPTDLPSSNDALKDGPSGSKKKKTEGPKDAGSLPEASEEAPAEELKGPKGITKGRGKKKASVAEDTAPPEPRMPKKRRVEGNEQEDGAAAGAATATKSKGPRLDESIQYPTDPIEPPHHKSNHVYSSAYKIVLQKTGNASEAQAKGREAAAQLRVHGVVSKALVGTFRAPKKPKNSE